MTLNIPNSIWDKYKEACDYFIDGLGSQCTLIYPPLKEDCNNCHGNTMIGGGSTSIYSKGNPAMFGGGICPACKNSGFIEREQTGTIQLRIYWSKKEWALVAPGVQAPDADVMIIGYLNDLPSLRRSNEIILVSDKTKYNTWRFTVSVEPFPHGFKKDRYFISFLKRVG